VTEKRRTDLGVDLPDDQVLITPQSKAKSSAEIRRGVQEIRGAGYSGVNDLQRDSDGTWHARAYKGPADVLVAVDRSGHISEVRQNGQSSY
jgi:hypothetical protein